MTCVPSGPAPARAPTARTPVRTVDAVALERRADGGRVARVIRGRQSRAGLDDRRRDPEPDVDLGELAAGRAAAEDDQAAGQLAGEGRLAIGPRRHRVQARDRRHLRAGPDRDDDVPAGQVVFDAVVADRDLAARRDRRLAAIDRRAGRLEPAHVAAVIGLGGIGRAIDHPVAMRGGARPVVARRIGGVLGGAVEQRLGRQAADVRAAAAEPAPVGDRPRWRRARGPCTQPLRRPGRRR